MSTLRIGSDDLGRIVRTASLLTACRPCMAACITTSARSHPVLRSRKTDRLERPIRISRTCAEHAQAEVGRPSLAPSTRARACMSGLPRPVAPESDSFRPAEFSSVLIDAPRLRAGAARRRGRPVNASCYATQGNGEAVTNPLSARVAWVVRNPPDRRRTGALFCLCSCHCRHGMAGLA